MCKLVLKCAITKNKGIFETFMTTHPKFLVWKTF